ncbi:MAG: PD-(D/E)XK nuclease family protein [Verrucomicrobiota bacterium]|nr:PD-(D/E)XK nuclease family protein [Verrucomicrobiota bacterium]
MSVERQLFDWNRPFSDVLGDWLWERRERLPGMLVIVPTAQSGRRLRQALAERGGVLSPKVQTPAFFLRGEGCAPDSVELIAWVEVLDSITDWGEFSVTFPTPPDGSVANWSISLAKSLAQLRATLSSAALTMRSAARRMKGSVEEERWQELAELEGRVESKLNDWGWKSRSEMIQSGIFAWPDETKEVVLAGVSDISIAAEAILDKCPLPVQVLVSGENEEDFDEWGRPLGQWIEQDIFWPGEDGAAAGSVVLTGDARQQAQRACQIVAESGSPSNEVALGSADEEVSRNLERIFNRSGWNVFNPGKTQLPSVAGWLAAWRAYLRVPAIPEVIDLISFEESGVQVRGKKRAQRVKALSELRDKHMVGSGDDLIRIKGVLQTEIDDAGNTGGDPNVSRSENDLKKVELALETMELLKDSRARFLRDGFHSGMKSLLSSVDPDHESNAAEWLEETAKVAEMLERPAGYWLELLLAGLRPVIQRAPDGERVLDVQGWLELFYESCPHLVICGMNDGLVPLRSTPDTWLPASTRSILGLVGEEQMTARDAYLLRAMLKAREKEGRVDLLVGKSSSGGDVLKPSRLLLSAKGKDLARKVSILFQEIKPAEAGVAKEIEEQWKWQIRTSEPMKSIRVTDFSAYLSCPFRFYLSRIRRMSRPEEERREWNARDFGTIVHTVVERFGRHAEAREDDDPRRIELWVHDELDRWIRERFGENPAVAVRIQREVMRQRLSWFAHIQAGQRAEGWRIKEVERDLAKEIGGVKLGGKIDRIERNEKSGLIRVLDYKTSSNIDRVDFAHCKKLKANTFCPEHLDGVDDVLCTVSGSRDGQKQDPARWIDLQIPLYALALEGDKDDKVNVDEIGYFLIGQTEKDVNISTWPDFGEDTKKSALRCAEWVLTQVAAGNFWPPAEKVKNDDFVDMAMDHQLEEVVKWVN